jgi:RNA polymerase sigma-70 factor (ECF subfamily)
VFLARYYREIKFDDLARDMGLSTGAVKASYHHASEKIKEYIRNSAEKIENRFKPQ